MRQVALGVTAGLLVAVSARGSWSQEIEANRVVEITVASDVARGDPFNELDLDVIWTRPDSVQLRVPAFWAGGRRWAFRYASDQIGPHAWRTECSDPSDGKLHAAEGTIVVVPYRGDNPLYRHGALRVAANRRHFEHSDGTPFFWLGDTWWKGLSKRISREGFQKLAADRKEKGFTVVQIVAGPYPDEPPFDPRWENEGGMPYEEGYARVNPAYFDHADRRIQHLLESGLVPAIVGGWGWHMPSIGVEKMKKHWRYLIARYAAYPVVWIVGGESGGPEWTAVALYVRRLDPFRRLITTHPYSSGRQALTDDGALDFDMLQTGHGGGWGAPLGDYAAVAANTVSKVTSHRSKTPAMPVLVGEVTYEGHMMTNGPDIQRFMFWSSILCGAAGHTYGAGGIWQMNSEAERGAEYEFTPWFEAMRLPGSTQLGLGKKLLEEYPWWRFEPHPEWVEPHSTVLLDPHAEWYDDSKEFAARGGRWDLPYAAGIPGEARVIYIPGHYYDWSAPTVKRLERGASYRAFFFCPASGKRYSLGTIVSSGPPPKLFEDHTMPRIFEDRFLGADASAWKDYGTPTHRKEGRLVGGKGMVTVVETISEADLMVSVEANSDAEAGIILRFHDPSRYLVALYSPSLKSIFLHDRKDGRWGDPLGQVSVPEIGPRIRLTAAACGDHAAMVLSDGERSYHTRAVRVSNTSRGRVGLWLFQIGERQEYSDFEVSRTRFAPAKPEPPELPAPAGTGPGEELPLVLHENPNVVPAVRIPELTILEADEYRPPRLPAPQDWVLVLERVLRQAASPRPGDGARR